MKVFAASSDRVFGKMSVLTEICAWLVVWCVLRFSLLGIEFVW